MQNQVIAGTVGGVRVVTLYVDAEPRRNERPSDHAPAVAEFSLSDEG